MDSTLFLVGSEHFFNLWMLLLAGLLSGMVQNLAYCILKMPTFEILGQKNNNSSKTFLKELDGKNHQSSLCKCIIIIFPDGLSNFATSVSSKLGMN